MIAWREKTRAFAVHFLVTLLFTASAAALVFLIWFPDPFQRMLGGTQLFEVLVMCDLGLGPLASFFIYSSKKSRRALLFDYAVVGSIQLAAFFYGLYVVANTRPVYVVFAVDQLEVVTAGEIDDADLARAPDAYRKRPIFGPQLVGIRRAQDSQERTKMLFSGLAGKDYPVLPAYYVPYEQNLPQIRQRASPVSDLEKRHPDAEPLISKAAAQLQIPVEKLVWLRVRHSKGFWTALLDPDSGRPVCWLPVDPD